MADFGMQLPGGRGSRRPTLTVYTGLLFLAVVALATACGIMYTAATKVGVDGNAFSFQAEGDVRLAAPAK